MNLALGWFMYQQENDGRLMSATMESREDNGTRVGWIGLPRGADGVPFPASAMTRTAPPVTDEDEKVLPHFINPVVFSSLDNSTANGARCSRP